MFCPEAILNSSKDSWIKRRNVIICHLWNFSPPLDRPLSLTIFCLCWNTRHLLTLCRIPVPMFVSSPLPYPSVHTSRNYHVTSKQICSIYQFAKVGKTSFFYHHSTYTVNTSHACLLSFNWDITSEAKSLLNYTDTINPFTFCLASKATIAFWRWEELVVQSNDRKISPAWRRKTKTWRKWNICHPILRCPDAP